MLLAMVAEALGAPVTEVKTTFEVKTNYFAVSGSSLSEIRQNLRRARPWSMPFDAWTNWKLRWHVQWQEFAGQTSARSVEVRTTALITLPIWQAGTKSTPEVREAWWAYLRALATHEQGHLQIARDATREVEQRLRSLPPFNSAAAAKAEATRVANDVVEQFRKLERSYDAETGHGATQGASLRNH